MRERPGDILELIDHDDYDLAVPTPDHFIPLIYIAALAAATDDTTDVLVEGPAFGSLSMTSYSLGADCPQTTSENAAAYSPRQNTSPADQSNI